MQEVDWASQLSTRMKILRESAHINGAPYLHPVKVRARFGPLLAVAAAGGLLLPGCPAGRPHTMHPLIALQVQVLPFFSAFSFVHA